MSKFRSRISRHPPAEACQPFLQVFQVDTHSPEKSDRGNITRDAGVGSPQASEKAEGKHRTDWPRQPRSQPLGPPHWWERGAQDVSSGPHHLHNPGHTIPPLSCIARCGREGPKPVFWGHVGDEMTRRTASALQSLQCSGHAHSPPSIPQQKLYPSHHSHHNSLLLLPPSRISHV